MLLVVNVLCAEGQDWQFSFDGTGNLYSQTTASSSLPQIISPPQLQVVQPEELASFSVLVADTRGLSYQWRFNGINLSGATSDSLLLTNVSLLNEGLYSVVLSFRQRDQRASGTDDRCRWGWFAGFMGTSVFRQFKSELYGGL